MAEQKQGGTEQKQGGTEQKQGGTEQKQGGTEQKQGQQTREFITGMPKSGCSWKKLSKKSSGNTKDKGLHKSWKEKQRIRQLEERRKEKIRTYEAKEEKTRQDIFKSIKERKKQKEFNQFNTQRLEIIKDSRKIKKWNKKAREQLVKVPAEVFEKLVHKHTLKK